MLLLVSKVQRTKISELNSNSLFGIKFINDKLYSVRERQLGLKHKIYGLIGLAPAHHSQVDLNCVNKRLFGQNLKKIFKTKN